MTAPKLSRDERLRLQRLSRSTSAPFAVVQRGRAIVELRRGVSPSDVARRVGATVRWVYKWRSRWEHGRVVECLLDADRSGRPPTISVVTKCELVTIACNRPRKALLSVVWTQQELAEELFRRTKVRVSRSTVQRVLSAEGIRPHKVRQWLHSPDPLFREKVERVCDLYLHPPPGSVVVSIDEKPMQALTRKHPVTRQEDGIVRREYEYVRHGACYLLASFDVQTGEVLGKVVKRRTGAALVAFLDEVARNYPGQQVYVVWDNLNTHKEGKSKRWTAFNREHGERFHFVYTPLHASWVNQVEIWFSILQRRVLRHGSFTGYPDLKSAVLGFIARWNRLDAHPFRWTFTGKFEQSPKTQVA
jgi:transposase